jgi:hypothetical protein
MGWQLAEGKAGVTEKDGGENGGVRGSSRSSGAVGGRKTKWKAKGM